MLNKLAEGRNEEFSSIWLTPHLKVGTNAKSSERYAECKFGLIGIQGEGEENSTHTTRTPYAHLLIIMSNTAPIAVLLPEFILS